MYPSLINAWGTVWLTILITPPPTSFLYFTSARSGSIPVVSQSIMKPIVPVGAMTVVCALRKPLTLPFSYASIPRLQSGLEQRRGHPAAVDVVHRVAVHPDDIQERMLITQIAREMARWLPQSGRWSSTTGRT